MDTKVEFLQAADGQWFWHLITKGRITCSAQGYNTRVGVKKAFRRHCDVIRLYFC